jgi:hypothetical protein
VATGFVSVSPPVFACATPASPAPALHSSVKAANEDADFDASRAAEGTGTAGLSADTGLAGFANATARVGLPVFTCSAPAPSGPALHSSASAANGYANFDVPCAAGAPGANGLSGDTGPATGFETATAWVGRPVLACATSVAPSPPLKSSTIAANADADFDVPGAAEATTGTGTAI